jgi:hypothetical protein
LSPKKVLWKEAMRQATHHQQKHEQRIQHKDGDKLSSAGRGDLAFFTNTNDFWIIWTSSSRLSAIEKADSVLPRGVCQWIQAIFPFLLSVI